MIDIVLGQVGDKISIRMNCMKLLLLDCFYLQKCQFYIIHPNKKNFHVFNIYSIKQSLYKLPNILPDI